MLFPNASVKPMKLPDIGIACRKSRATPMRVMHGYCLVLSIALVFVDLLS